MSPSELERIEELALIDERLRELRSHEDDLDVPSKRLEEEIDNLLLRRRELTGRFSWEPEERDPLARTLADSLREARPRW